MNYRHEFHAGNAADVFKHHVLCTLLDLLKAKEAPFFVLDSHGGAGGYLLAPGGEHEGGIGPLWERRSQWPELATYFEVVARYNTDGRLRRYPGSPLFIRDLIRAQDRAVVIELHPEEHRSVHSLLQGDRRFSVHLGDAWNLIKAFTPPREPRGLALIDPPFEQHDDFHKIVTALQHLRHHWRAGVGCAWYPIKSMGPARTLLAEAAAIDPEALAIHFMTLPQDVAHRLNGSGVVLINPPWRLEEQLRASLPKIAAAVAGAAGAPEVVIAKAARLTQATARAGSGPRRMR